MLGLIVNRRAGRSRKWTASQLRQSLAPGDQLHFTDSLDDIPTTLTALHHSGCKLMVPVGGDGTLSQVLRHALDIWGPDDLPSILPVRGGTMNMVADHLRQPSRTLEQALNAVARRDSHQLRHTSRRLILSDAGAVGFSFGFGAAVRFLERYVESGAGTRAALTLLGQASASALFGSGLARELLTPAALQVRIDGEPPQTREWSTFFAMTIDHLPLRFAVAPGAAARPDHMHLIYGQPSARFIVRHLWDLKRGQRVESRELRHGQARRVQLNFATPTAWMMDGEIYPPRQTLGLRLGPTVSLILA